VGPESDDAASEEERADDDVMMHREQSGWQRPGCFAVDRIALKKLFDLLTNRLFFGLKSLTNTCNHAIFYIVISTQIARVLINKSNEQKQR